MSANGRVDYKELEEYMKKVQKSLSPMEIEKFIENCARELAARLLAKVIKRTPVGQYPASSGKKGGTLRRGWTGGKRASAVGHARTLKVHHYSKYYVIEIENPTEYAIWVEYGHRTPNHEGWVEGRFMMTISAEEINEVAPRILERKLKQKLEEAFA